MLLDQLSGAGHKERSQPEAYHWPAMLLPSQSGHNRDTTIPINIDVNLTPITQACLLISKGKDASEIVQLTPVLAHAGASIK
ncbi:MAG: hypothetical protein QGD88_11320 [Anaerolineae bacterium]|nr:hypothetical protein [Anaerolineae bacterium]MDK1082051.1 hypothetical protein [Anaerolineae bacterium]